MSHPTPHIRPTLQNTVKTSVVVRHPNQNILFAIGLFLALSLLAILFFSPDVSADPLVPDAPGLIAGVAKNAAGEPLADIQVTLFRRSPYSSDSWELVRSVATQADGKYRFGLLAVGIYRIGAVSIQGLYAPIFYPTAPTIQKAIDLILTGNQLTGIDMVLSSGGQIMGVVTATVGTSLTYGFVELRQALVRQGVSNWEQVQYVGVPIGGRVYSFTHLAADVYRVCAGGGGSEFSTYECYDNVYDVNRATSLTLTADATISNVNLILGDTADYAQIGGRVTDLDNEPLPGIEVYAIRSFDAPFPFPQYPGLPVLVPIATPTPPATAIPTAPLAAADSGDPGYYGYPFARTDAQGAYRLATLAEGTYRLYFYDRNDNYAFEYYNDSTNLNDGTTIQLASSQVVSNINVQLALGSYIQGVITVLGQPVPAGYVAVEMKTPLGWTTLANESIDPNNGRYDIGGLPVGRYRVMAFVNISYDSSTNYYYQGYFGGASPDSATEIMLTAGETKTADIMLSGGPQFKGSLSGQVTAGNAPLANAKVSLYRGDSYCCTQPLQPFVYVQTDAEGLYTINGLTSGTFQLGVTDPAGVYATTYYTNHTALQLANSLHIEDGTFYIGFNVDLPLAGAINGRVTRRNGQPVADLLVSIYKQSPHFGEVYLISMDTSTDTQGGYTIKGLHAGNYYVCFSASQSGYNKCYGMVNPFYGVFYSKPVKVTAGATTANIDVIWDPDLQSYLPIIAR